jgi:hypothetical protein
MTLFAVDVSKVSYFFFSLTTHLDGFGVRSTTDIT